MKTQSVVIEKVVTGALGLARLEDGRVVFVDRVLPGEKATVTIRREKKQYLHAEPVKVSKPHPRRIEPACPWYGQCGGCNLQHCAYELQLDIKTAIVEDLVGRRFAKTTSGSPYPIRATLPSPSQFGYRQRIRLQIDKDGRFGFAAPRSHTLVPIDRCLVAHEALNTVLFRLQADISHQRLLVNCREVELLLNPISTGVVCLFHLRRRPRPADIQQADDLVSDLGLERLFFQGEDFALTDPLQPKGQPAADSLQMTMKPFGDTGAAIRLNWEVGGFCQVNLEQNEQLVKYVLSLCNLQGSESVLDLFCGMGNFSIPLARLAGTVVGFEGQGSAVRSARRNSLDAGLDNTQFYKAPIHDVCRRLIEDHKVFDYLILDPPRQGVPGLATELATLTGRTMIYISCDPATLSRDLKALCRCGLRIVHVQPFDMFPQTHHIETVVVLEKN